MGFAACKVLMLSNSIDLRHGVALISAEMISILKPVRHLPESIIHLLWQLCVDCAAQPITTLTVTEIYDCFLSLMDKIFNRQSIVFDQSLKHRVMTSFIAVWQ